MRIVGDDYFHRMGRGRRKRGREAPRLGRAPIRSTCWGLRVYLSALCTLHPLILLGRLKDLISPLFESEMFLRLALAFLVLAQIAASQPYYIRPPSANPYGRGDGSDWDNVS